MPWLRKQSSRWSGKTKVKVNEMKQSGPYKQENHHGKAEPGVRQGRPRWGWCLPWLRVCFLQQHSSGCLAFLLVRWGLKKKTTLPKMINDSVSEKLKWMLLDSPWPHGLILQARILKCVAFPFSRGSSQLRDQTQVSRIASRFSTKWATREAQEYWSG